MGETNENNLRAHCESHDELHAWILQHTGLRIPRQAVCPNHFAPWEYIHRAYFEPAGDLVVWAPRGGGKTTLGAVATLLDLLHKPDCQVRILGGSLEQSLKMWEHLHPLLCKLAGGEIPDRPSARRVQLKNGSTAAVLTQSQRAVRGLRVQKLRCDEVELFEPDIWEALQLATRSTPGASDAQPTSGCVEALSTLHKRFGLMQTIIDQAQARGVPIIRWCLLDVLERCPAERECGPCVLKAECGGVAKSRCDGYIRIDDAVRMKSRVSVTTWETEMLCLRPSTRGAVFPHFDPDVHVRDFDLPASASLTLSLDFGFNAPFVCLWIATLADQTLRVIDEYVQDQLRVADHLKAICARQWPPTLRITCDPAGSARNDQTAKSNVQLLREAGYAVRFRKSHISDGVEMIRTALAPAAGKPSLFIHPRCQRLIRALSSYRFAGDNTETPLKDGTHDHLIDALRYFLVNRGPDRAAGRDY